MRAGGEEGFAIALIGGFFGFKIFIDLDDQAGGEGSQANQGSPMTSWSSSPEEPMVPCWRS